MNPSPFFVSKLDSLNPQYMMIDMNSTHPADLLKLAEEHEAVARKLREAANALMAVRAETTTSTAPISQYSGPITPSSTVHGATVLFAKPPTGLQAMINALGESDDPLYIESIVVGVKRQGADLERGSILSNLSRNKHLFVNTGRGYWTLTPQERDKYNHEHKQFAPSGANTGGESG